MDSARSEAEQAQASERRNLVGSGGRSEQVKNL